MDRRGLLSGRLPSSHLLSGLEWLFNLARKS